MENFAYNIGTHWRSGLPSLQRASYDSDDGLPSAKARIFYSPRVKGQFITIALHAETIRLLRCGMLRPMPVQINH
jgi:hypothetical protein